MKFKVLVCDPISDEGIRLMEEKGLEITKAWDLPKTDLLKIIGEYHAVVVRSATKITADLMLIARKIIEALGKPPG